MSTDEIMEELDVLDYMPISYGWLKMLPFEILFLAWVGVLIWGFMPHHKLPHSGAVGIGIALVVFGLVAWSYFKTNSLDGVKKFVFEYWHRDVRGCVANFSFSSPKYVGLFIAEDIPTYGPEVLLLWRVRLGGWRKEKPELLKRSDFEDWEKIDWVFEPVDFLYRDPSSLLVRMKDYAGNSIEAFLLEAFRYIHAYEKVDLRALVQEKQELEELNKANRTFITSLRLKVREMIKENRTIGLSPDGKAFIKELERVVYPWPN